jgi:DNA-binding helix-hairpin-helix protein with protein kinase domain
MVSESLHAEKHIWQIKLIDCPACELNSTHNFGSYARNIYTRAEAAAEPVCPGAAVATPRNAYQLAGTTQNAPR